MDQSIEDLQSQVDMIEQVARAFGPDDPDAQYWRDNLQQQYAQLAVLQQQRENSTMLGSVAYPLLQPNGYTSPASAVSSAPSSRKRSFGLTADGDGRDPKRVSANQSPLTPGTPNSQFGGPIHHHQQQQQQQQQWTLPNRSNGAPAQEPWSFVDLTVSDPPSPEPFPELVNAFRDDGARPTPADAFNQEFMPENELAQFLMNPTPANGGYALQQGVVGGPGLPPPGFDFPTRDVPYLPGPQRPAWLLHDSEEDDEAYGNFPLNATEVESIEKMLEIVEQNGNDSPDDREQTPRIMSSTLKEYQKLGLTWLLKMEAGRNKGGILADEMGLGKTVSCASCEHYVHSKARATSCKMLWPLFCCVCILTPPGPSACSHLRSAFSGPTM
jgi:hypothetical protein